MKKNIIVTIFNLFFLILLINILLGVPISSADGMFYVSPKVMFGSYKVDIGPPSISVSQVPGRPYKVEYTGEYKGLPFEGQKYSTFAALAFGVDFFERFGWPFRLDVEISSRADANMEGYAVTYFDDDPNTPLIDFRPSPYQAYRGFAYASISSFSYRMHTAFLNLYVDWHNKSHFTPYFGGGVGILFLETTTTYNVYLHQFNYVPSQTFGQLSGGSGPVIDNNRIKQMIWHLDIGLTWALTTDFSLEIGYRYVNLGKDIEFGPICQHREPYIDMDPDHDDGIVSKGPDKIRFAPVHQAILGFKYTF